jgi:hypothetical protein
MNSLTSKKVDKLDQDAIRSWKRKQKRRKNDKLRPESAEIHDLRKIVDLYKMYGNDKLALVNPVENPKIL